MTGLPFAVHKLELPPEQVEIRAWLKANRETLAGREANEVAHMAVMCGFEMNDVCATLSDFRDAMQGSHVDNRAALHLWSFEMAVDRFQKMKLDLERPKELDLMPLWKDLVAYTITG